MPSRRQSSAMLSSPRRPSSTTRIFSSAEKCRRVARRMSFTTSSAGDLTGPDLCLIFAPSKRYDEPEILSSSIRRICLIDADGGQLLSLTGALEAATGMALLATPSLLVGLMLGAAPGTPVGMTVSRV